MTTAFSAVVAAVIAALEVDPPVCDTIYRSRQSPIPDQVAEAINVQFEGAMPRAGAIFGAPVDWTSKVTVECYAWSLRDSGDLAVDPLLERVYARLAGNTNLSGAVDDIGYPSIEAENSVEGKKTGWVRMTYLIEHRTSNLTLN